VQSTHALCCQSTSDLISFSFGRGHSIMLDCTTRVPRRLTGNLDRERIEDHLNSSRRVAHDAVGQAAIVRGLTPATHRPACERRRWTGMPPCCVRRGTSAKFGHGRLLASAKKGYWSIVRRLADLGDKFERSCLERVAGLRRFWNINGPFFMLSPRSISDCNSKRTSPIKGAEQL
jgi:hypothetical protein